MLIGERARMQYFKWECIPIFRCRFETCMNIQRLCKYLMSATSVCASISLKLIDGSQCARQQHGIFKFSELEN